MSKADDDEWRAYLRANGGTTREPPPRREAPVRTPTIGIDAETRTAILLIIWQLASIATFVKLTFFDGYNYTAWNWFIAIPANVFLSEIWPIYWLILRPIFGP